MTQLLTPPQFIFQFSPTTNPLVTPTWVDISRYVLDFHCKYGRQFELNRMEAGTADFRLDNSDRRFDPTNSAGPYYGNLLPMKKFQVISPNVIPVNAGSPFTVSGFEITDATRTTNTQGDGLTVPNGFGIWEAATNLLTNGGFETNTTGWSDGSTVQTTISVDSSQFKFGAKSLKAVGLVSNTLTLSGNEITDATRTAAAAWTTSSSGGMVDAFTSDSSFGIFRAATNLFRRGQCDALTDYNFFQAALSTDATTPPPFSTQSVKSVTSGISTGEGVSCTTATGLALATGVNCVGSIYFKGVLGNSYTVGLVITNTDASQTVGTATTFAATGSWQLLVGPSVAVAAAKTGDSIRIRVLTATTTRVESFWVAHTMLESGQTVVAPYVATFGGSTATHSASSVQANTATVSQTQGWFAIRFRTSWSSTDDPYGGAPGVGPQVIYFGNSGGTENITMFYRENSNDWKIRLNSGGTSQEALILGTHAAGDVITLVGQYNIAASGTVKLSLNGAAFVSGATTLIPAFGGSPVFQIGSSPGGGSPVNSQVIWAACGTGALTDADAAAINAFGNTDQTYASFNAALSNGAATRAVMPFATSAYTTGGVPTVRTTGTSLTSGVTYAWSTWVLAPLGAPIFLFNAHSNFTLISGTTYTGTGAWQRVTNVFTPMFSETVYSFLQLNPQTSTRGATFNIDGAQLEVRKTALSLTVSGNEITDATRTTSLTWTTSQSGGSTDGFTVPDSTYGIWESGTNLFRRGQCDATTDWNGAVGGETRSTDATTPPPFSTQSVKCICDGTLANQGLLATSATGQAAATGVLGVGSYYFKGVAGQSYRAQVRWINTDVSVTDGVQTLFTATGSWQLLSPAAVAVAAGKTGDQLLVHIRINGTRAETFWAAHTMLQTNVAIASPYIATSGGSTASRSSARVQAPSTLVTAGQGWWAARVRMGFSDTTGANFTYSPRIATWINDVNNRLLLLYDRVNKKFVLESQTGGGAFAIASTAGVTFNAGDVFTVIGRWDGTTLKVSVNGAAFASVSSSGSWPTLTASTFDIGSEGTTNEFDGNFLWFASGTGVLTDANAATINGFGNTDTFVDSFPGTPTMMWSADSAAYTVANALNQAATPYIETNGGTASRTAARVQAPGTLLDKFQSWVAVRGRHGKQAAAANGGRTFWFGPDNTAVNRIAGTMQSGVSDHLGSVQMNNNDNGSGTVTAAINGLSWNVGDVYTVIYAWTSTTLFLSYNGSAFISTPRGGTPTGTWNLDFGSNNGLSDWLDGNILWAAGGTGTLSNADVTTVNALPNTLTTWTATSSEPVGDATSMLWPTNSSLTFVWPAATSTYRIPSTAYVWTGYIEAWPMVWEGPSWSEVDCTAVDALEALAQAEVVSTPATFTTTQGGNKDLTFTSLGIGSGNNLISVDYTNTGTLTVSVSGLAIVVGINPGVTTASAILAALNSDPNASTLITTTLAPGSSGAGLPGTGDPLYQLAGGMFPQALSGSQINSILDNISWPVGDRAIDAGASTVAAVVYQRGDHQKAKTHINNVEDSELGYIFANTQGLIVYHDRNHRSSSALSTTSQAIFGDSPTVGLELEYSNVVPSFDKTYIYNYIGITPFNGSVAQTAQDSTSQAQYMLRAYTISSQLINATDALNLAQYILLLYKQPSIRFSKMTFTPMNDVGLWLQAFSRMLGDRITVNRRPPTYYATAGPTLSIDSFLESVEWTMRPGQLDAEINYEMSPAAILGAGLKLDDATLGKLDNGNTLGL